MLLLTVLLVAAGTAAPAHTHVPHAARQLRPPTLRRLPTGATKPNGWLERELQLQAKGMTGQLPYFWGYINHSNWMNPSGGSMPEQFVPYYVNGLFPLSYQLDDPNLNALRDR